MNVRPTGPLAVRRVEVFTVPPAMTSLTALTDALTRPVARELLAAHQAAAHLGHMDVLGFWFGICHDTLPCRDYTRERQRMNRAVSSAEPRKQRGISQGIGGTSTI